MKHVEVVKAVRVGGVNYTNPRAAAQRWVEQAGADIMSRHQVATFGNWRAQRAWDWYRDHCMLGKRQRYWRRVLPIFERLLP